jgi:hypothetical protein
MSDDRLKTVQLRVDEVTNITRDNIIKSSNNIQNLDDLDSRSQVLYDSSNQFYDDARRTRRMMCFRSYKMLALVVLGVSIVLVIIIAPIAVSLS